MKDTDDMIFKSLGDCTGGKESERIFTITHVKTGETEVCVEKSVREYYPIQQLDRAKKAYKFLTDGNGGSRGIVTLNHALKIAVGKHLAEAVRLREQTKVRANTKPKSKLAPKATHKD